VETEGITLELREAQVPVRGVDPIVLVALVGAGSTALGALVAGVFKIMEAKYGRKIVISGSQGRRVELTGEFTKEQIDEFVRQAREIDAEQIYIK
jgi:alpha-galactosidase/6-phospho-beta-glucosidase family protein